MVLGTKYSYLYTICLLYQDVQEVGLMEAQALANVLMMLNLNGGVQMMMSIKTKIQMNAVKEVSIGLQG